MSFNSLPFLILLVITFTAYRLLHRSVRAQNRLLLLASYVFYGWWDWRFLSLLWIQTAVDFYAGRAMGQTDSDERRRRLLYLSLGLNLGLLGFFKYFNFFADSTVHVLNALGLHADPLSVSIVLPAGISFYTFQTMSYTIEVYRRQMEPTDNLLDFAAFVAFFPHLVAGPIMRATVLLPQVLRPRHTTRQQVDDGIFLMLWGYFKKCVVADNVALIATQVFNHPRQHAGLDLTLGVLAFAVQIYADFSAYSDIARGISKLMGFELVINFRLPYFARTPSEFWQRWHISLSTWLRDYLYIPLGGNRGGTAKTVRNLMITMLLGGLWHGAAWHFVAWGAYHGLLLVLYRPFELRQARSARAGGEAASVSPLGTILQIGVMFGFTLVGWVLFRAATLSDAWYIVSHAGLRPSATSAATAFDWLWFTAPLLLMQCYQAATADLLRVAKWPPWLRGLCYTLLVVWMVVFTPRAASEFIYFQF